MKRILLCLLLLVSSVQIFGQKKLIKKLLSNEKDTTRGASFMPVPVLGYSQEIGFEFGAGALYSTYLDKSDTLNRSSNFSSHVSISTKKQYNLSLQGYIWTKGNDYHLIADLRLKKMPFNFYCLGNETLETNEDRIVQNQFKVLLDFEKRIFPFAYTGVSIGFENYNFRDEFPGGIYQTQRDIYGKKGGSVLFLGISQSYDTRNSNNYPTRGFFGRLTYQYAPHFFGDDNFSGSQIELSASKFWPLAKKVVLGVNGFFHTLQGRQTPNYLLPQLGNDELMRGYYTGRYRDENLIALQTELRYRFMHRFGVVAFAGTGKVFADHDVNLKGFKPSYGIGGRYFFDPEKGLSIRLDYGIGEKRPNEKRQSGFYISLAEAF